jgi:predicted metal-dependent phosphoesterase TrpH
MSVRTADLQLHSTASDGSDDPSEVVRRAAALGFAAIALTDHDTLDGVAEAQQAASSAGLTCIPACEISSIDDDERQIDILAYGISLNDPSFSNLLRSLREGRFGRAWAMVEQLNANGHAVAFDRVVAIAGGPSNLGRPHVAKAMVEAGIVPDVASAFTPDLILEGGRCYVQRVKISPADAIARVHAAGGVAVAAHPGRTGLTATDVEALAKSGLDGIEAFYPRHSPDDTVGYLRAAYQHGLLITGGSDDHGDINEGRLMGSVRLPFAHVERLQSAIQSRQREASL